MQSFRKEKMEAKRREDRVDTKAKRTGKQVKQKKRKRKKKEREERERQKTGSEQPTASNPSFFRLSTAFALW